MVELDSNPEKRIALFQRKEVRRVIHNNEWWFVIIDVVAVLTDSPNPQDYFKDMRKRDPQLAEALKGGGANCPPLGLEFDTAGGFQLLQCWNTEGIFRLIQSIPSPKAEPFKRWLARVGYERIGELHKIWRESLPVAIFVPTETDVTPTAELLRTPLFEEYGITVEACLQGLILGTQANVRVFSIQFIKGLEFEAVFFLGADRMAAVSPELVDKFLYVGLTRARSFLAVITHSDFPQELSHVQHFFKQGTWEHLVPPQNPDDV
jgi:hypothetical protein